MSHATYGIVMYGIVRWARFSESRLKKPVQSRENVSDPTQEKRFPFDTLYTRLLQLPAVRRCSRPHLCSARRPARATRCFSGSVRTRRGLLQLLPSSECGGPNGFPREPVGS